MCLQLRRSGQAQQYGKLAGRRIQSDERKTGALCRPALKSASPWGFVPSEAKWSEKSFLYLEMSQTRIPGPPSDCVSIRHIFAVELKKKEA